jgi:hypothetical protein
MTAATFKPLVFRFCITGVRRRARSGHGDLVDILQIIQFEVGRIVKGAVDGECLNISEMLFAILLIFKWKVWQINVYFNLSILFCWYLSGNFRRFMSISICIFYFADI